MTPSSRFRSFDVRSLSSAVWIACRYRPKASRGFLTHAWKSSKAPFSALAMHLLSAAWSAAAVAGISNDSGPVESAAAPAVHNAVRRDLPSSFPGGGDGGGVGELHPSLGEGDGVVAQARAVRLERL